MYASGHDVRQQWKWKSSTSYGSIEDIVAPLDGQSHNRRMAGPRENLGAKSGLITASLSVGIAVGVFTFWSIAYDTKGVTRHGFFGGSYRDTEWVLNGNWPFGLFLGLTFTTAASLLYPVVGVYLLSVRDKLRNKAYEIADNSNDEKTDDRIGWSAVWPIAFPCSVILYVFLILFNRLFQSSPQNEGRLSFCSTSRKRHTSV